MAFIAMDGTLGEVDLSTFDSAGPGPLSFVGSATGAGRQNFAGQIITAYDPFLGAGEFVFSRATTAAAGTAGNVCEFQPQIISGAAIPTIAGWAGTANSGKPLCVVLTPGTAVGQWAWFQIGGTAIVNCTGAPVAGNPVYWVANNTVSPTAAAGKQVMNAVFASAPGVTIGTGTSAITLSATQALVFLNRPFNQGAIT